MNKMLLGTTLLLLLQYNAMASSSMPTQTQGSNKVVEAVQPEENKQDNKNIAQLISKEIKEIENNLVETKSALIETLKTFIDRYESMEQRLNVIENLFKESCTKGGMLSLKDIIDEKIKNYQSSIKDKLSPSLPHYTKAYKSFMEDQKAVLEVEELSWYPSYVDEDFEIEENFCLK